MQETVLKNTEIFDKEQKATNIFFLFLKWIITVIIYVQNANFCEIHIS